MDWIKKNYDYALLTLILLIGAWLRFHNLAEISFSNDELSALKRARFDSFHDEITKGVMVDGHPALVQLMIWSVIHIFNDNVFTIKFLFAVSGIVSILLIFLLAKRWFGITTALLSAAALATLQFPVLYSQTARPYIIGLMFTLAAAYFWTKLLFSPPAPQRGDQQPHNPTEGIRDGKPLLGRGWGGYILCSTACLYTHYFSFMMAGLIGISGLFFLKKNNYKNYLLCNIAVLLLFIPHISIFTTQLSYGGIGSWLAPPKSDFLVKFIHYGFNDSSIVFALFALILIPSLIFFVSSKGWNKFHSLALAWYIVPFLIGYYYSIHIAPVLQYSTLIFSFPFLLIFIFSFITHKQWLNKKIIALLTLIVLVSGVYSTVVQNKYYKVNHFGVFKELAQNVKEWDEKFGKENITTSFTLTTPEYINYYFRKLNHEPAVAIYTDDERRDFKIFSAVIDSSKTEYFAYAWTNSPHYYETIELIQEKYPVVAYRDTFFNSEITLFKRGNVENGGGRLVATILAGTSPEKMDEKREYSTTYKSTTAALNLKAGEMLKGEVSFNAADSLENATIVIEFSKNGETIQWSGMPLRYFYNKTDKWQRAILCTIIPDVPDAEVGIYIWNPGKKTFLIQNFKISVNKNNALYRVI